MIYSEATYFNGYHFAHIAVWEERQRLNRKRLDACKALGDRATRRSWK